MVILFSSYGKLTFKLLSRKETSNAARVGVGRIGVNREGFGDSVFVPLGQDSEAKHIKISSINLQVSK